MTRTATGLTARAWLIAGASVSLIFGVAATASAAPAPPFGDHHAIGTISLYDKQNHIVTGGSTATSLQAEAVKAVGSGLAPDGFNDGVELTLWVPQDGVDPSQWSGAPLSLTTKLTPQAKKQDAVVAPLDKWPLDRDLIEASGPSKGRVANHYELRLWGIRYGPAESPDYFAAEIVVDPTAHTWRLVNSGSGGGSIPVSGIVGGIVGAVAVIGAVVFSRRRRRGRGSASPAPERTPVLQ